MTENRSTGISWTQHTLNFFVGCQRITSGCQFCYAERVAWRLQEFGAPTYQGVVKMSGGRPVWTGKVNKASAEMWRKPFRIKEPSLIFCDSMTDMFYEGVPDEWRVDAFNLMRAVPRHTYQVLTKRMDQVAPFLERTGISLPPNLWLGVTVERADVVHRIDTLRKVPAAVRFLSCEPLLGPLGNLDLTSIDWMIVGGESGPGARIMQEDWARDAIRQAKEQGTAIWFKQWGMDQSNPIWNESPDPKARRAYVHRHDPGDKGGCRLDGHELKQFPAAWVRRSHGG